MINRRNPPIDRLIVFGRYPVPERTKTRLISALGPAGAADLQRNLTGKTMETADAFASERGIKVEGCFEGGSIHKIRRWLGPHVSLSRQGPGDLGTRMHDAFLAAFQKGCRHAVLIGTDIPELRPDHLRQAFDALSENDLVIGPSIDGGYWLIGLNRPARLFDGIKWGTRAVFGQTLALADGQGLKVKELDYLKDMDTVEDLTEMLPHWLDKGPYVSVIIPAFNEALNIEKTIRKAHNNDTEVIVVDGGSDDDTVARATRTGARVERSSRGRAVQQNHGASAARSRVLLFLHADTHLPHGFINHIFEALMDPETVAGAFRFKTDLDHPLMKLIEFGANIRSRYLKLPYGDQGLFFRRGVFETVGGFPEVSIAEDLLLMNQISKQGRIRIASVHAVTSGRRWQTHGLLRTTLINQIIVAGCCLGISSRILARLYRVPGSSV